ncbi:DUF6127 family protein [Sphingomonas sp. 35-24ZXX]|uniref:DUF6127 family protein n=1 Tax=Sphingomonas sp. 35-24ZXX TaxID=1545915 RepID=UPI00053BF942|nr:DUF6127 family protein [Sphingomonas sp. 35-24ZXX]
MESEDMLASLLAQAAEEGADLATLRAVVEEAGDLGAGRALARIGLADASAGEDLRQLRELLQAWRDARSGVWGAMFDKFVRAVMAILLAALAVQLGVGDLVQ